ncbi:hypothetical protein B0H11DRAFT_2262263 [Mycena galericulata]|nr:hypothetical protein B0H11DRAFT_2262263 [Mycena galericulata]
MPSSSTAVHAALDLLAIALTSFILTSAFFPSALLLPMGSRRCWSQELLQERFGASALALELELDVERKLRPRDVEETAGYPPEKAVL